MSKQAIAIAVVLAFVAWLFRWEPTANGAALLDRWTGTIVIPEIKKAEK